MKIILLAPSHVLEINKQICEQNKTEHRCYDIGKIESALHSAKDSTNNNKRLLRCLKLTNN